MCVIVNKVRAVERLFQRPEWRKLWSEERFSECNLALGGSGGMHGRILIRS